MPLSSSSAAALRFIPEATYGVTPGTGNHFNARFTGESLAFSITKSESAEIRPDRQLTDLIPTDAEASGGFNFELLSKEYDTFLEAALMGTYAAYGTNGTGTSFVPTFAAPTGGHGGTITAGTAPTGNSAFTTLARGQWFKLNAAGSSNDGKFFRVHSTTAPTATVITLDPATPIAVSAAAGATLTTSRLVNGATERSFTIERQLTDVAQFFAYRGMMVNSMNLAFANGSITTGSFDFMGKDSVRAGATTLPGTTTASQTGDVMNGVTGFSSLLENGAALAGTSVTSLNLTIENGLRGRKGLGTLGNVGIGVGTFKASGTMEVYLADGTLYDKFINNTASSLQFVTVDSAKNGYAVQIPNLKYGDAQVTAGGKDQDIMLSLPFTAILDNTSGKTVLIDRLA